MRKQSEINRAIAYLEERNYDPICRIQREVLEEKRSESWVFNRYVRDVPEDEQNETLFYAARDAAMFLSGKIGISSICPDLEDGPEEEQELEETITLSLSEYKKLLLRLDRVERRLGLRVGDVAPAPRKDISEAPDELIGQADACRLIGCAKTTIKQWANKGLITLYQKGYNVYYSRRELLGSSVVRDYKDSKSNKE